MSEFQYAPLENPTSDLRLIRIEPSLGLDDLKCGLYTFKDYPWYIPPYRALSYVWGDATRKVPISLNGKTFLITTSLNSALRNLRCSYPSETRKQLPLWIDALCIDQGNPKERDEQVRRMKTIYQGAETVLIWLGNYREPSDEKMQATIHQLGIANNEVEYTRATSAFSLVLTLSELKKKAAESLDESLNMPPPSAYSLWAWVHLSQLFQRSWFERLWVIQELAVATKASVLCGQHEIPWKDFEGAASWIIRPNYASFVPREKIHRIFPLMGAHRVNQVSLKSMASVDPNNILTVLYHTQTAKCSDPRDRLFAVLGVVEDTADVEIDYSIPVHEVYRKWATKRIRRTRTLDLLNACADSSRSGDLPSWVPDLRRPWGQDKPLWLLSNSSYGHSEILLRPSTANLGLISNANEDLDFRFSPDGLQLQVIGTSIGLGIVKSVSSVGDAVTNLQNPTELTPRLKEIVTGWKQWFDDATGEGSYHSSNTDIDIMDIDFRDTLLRNAFGVFSNDNFFLEDHYGFRFRERQHGRRPTPSGGTADGRVEQPQQDAELKEFERKLFTRIHGCQMFVTESVTLAEVGIVAGNCQVQKGDELWFLTGGTTPFILRKVPRGHCVIGPCFTSKVMYGGLHRDDLLATYKESMTQVTLI